MAAFRTDMPLGKYWVELAISVAAAVVVRGSACTINDIFDREYDAGVGESLFLCCRPRQ